MNAAAAAVACAPDETRGGGASCHSWPPLLQPPAVPVDVAGLAAGDDPVSPPQGDAVVAAGGTPAQAKRSLWLSARASSPSLAPLRSASKTSSLAWYLLGKHDDERAKPVSEGGGDPPVGTSSRNGSTQKHFHHRAAMMRAHREERPDVREDRRDAHGLHDEAVHPGSSEPEPVLRQRVGGDGDDEGLPTRRNAVLGLEPAEEEGRK